MNYNFINNNNQDKTFTFYPPKSWQVELKSEGEISIYNELLDNYADEDQIVKVVKENGIIKNINKEELNNLVLCLVSKIKEITKNKLDKQLKIMGILKASEESLLTMLASAWLAAEHSICFEDLSKIAIQTRIEMFNPDVILCRKSYEYNFLKNIPSLINKESSLIILDLEDLKNVNKKNLNLIGKSEYYSADSSLFTLYTSGSTGKPKAITHEAKRYYEYAKSSTKSYFGLNSSSIIFTACDAGWINGHTYAVYGPLACGAKIVICEDLKRLSDPIYLVNLNYELKVTCLYLSVTLLRLLKGNEKDFNSNNQIINYLERIGSCGEPLAHEIGNWALEFFKPLKKTIVNTYFQTETGGIMVAPKEEDGIPPDYSSVGKPSKEIGLFIAKDQLTKSELEQEKINPDEILIKNPWDGIYKKVKSDRDVNYFTENGYFRFNDVGYFDKNGFLYIGGRSDDVINTAGHRIASSEIESICLSLNDIKEACVVSQADSLIGEKPILFITINKKQILQSKELFVKINQLINNKLSNYHQPENIFIFQDLPKTKSGKIMRRIMKEINTKYFLNTKSDFSSISNLSEFKESHKKFFESIIDNYLHNASEFSLRNFLHGKSYKVDSVDSSFLIVLMLLEKCFRSNIKLDYLNLNFIIQNKIGEINNFEFFFKKEESLIQIYNKLYKSNLKKVFLLNSFDRLIINIECIQNFGINIIFKSLQNNIFKIKSKNYLLSSSCSCNLEKSINEIINKYFLKNENLNTTKYNLINHSYKNKKQNNKKFCSECKINIDEMFSQRGRKAYLVEVINFEGKKVQICDLCFQGW
tara:strand:- start:203 stop:2644 length:2442 start_codon:yes stop_codon:yes gene_type:complete